MMNLKTWQTLCGIGFPLSFIASAAGNFGPDSPMLVYCSNVGQWFMVALGIVGGILGILFLLRRLTFKCPLCSGVGHVVGGTGKDIYLDCSSCGRVLGTIRWFRTPCAEVIDLADEEDEDSTPERLAPK